MEYRIEKDSMGELKVPADAYYGAQTARAVENFPISGLRFPRPFIKALGAIKHAAAEVNLELGNLDEERAKAIMQAAEEVMEGKLDDQFVVDIFQTGSGTSTNMNTNEVIAGRANEILTGKRGGKDPVHPNDHVNFGQSSNDTIPTAIHVSVAVQTNEVLLPALKHLHQALLEKAQAWDDVVKIGRTHLMDATPIRMGQEVSGWARQVELAIERLESTLPRLYELAQGGTAVGTGLNTHPEFGARVAEKLAMRFGLPFREAVNHFEAQHSKDAAVELAGQLHGGVFGVLCFEVVDRFAEWQAEAHRQFFGHARAELGVGIEAGAHRGAALGQLVKARQRALEPLYGQLHLARPAAYFLAHADGGGIHQVGAADLDHVVPGLRLLEERLVQVLQRRQQHLVGLHRDGHVNGGGNGVVRRLAEVYVVVGVHRVLAAALAGKNLVGAAGDHLIGVHVGRGAGAGLEDIDHELVVQLSLHHLLGSLHDGLGALFVEVAQL